MFCDRGGMPMQVFTKQALCEGVCRCAPDALAWARSAIRISTDEKQKSCFVDDAKTCDLDVLREDARCGHMDTAAERRTVPGS